MQEGVRQTEANPQCSLKKRDVPVEEMLGISGSASTEAHNGSHFNLSYGNDSAKLHSQCTDNHNNISDSKNKNKSAATSTLAGGVPAILGACRTSQYLALFDTNTVKPHPDLAKTNNATEKQDERMRIASEENYSEKSRAKEYKEDLKVKYPANSASYNQEGVDECENTMKLGKDTQVKVEHNLSLTPSSEVAPRAKPTPKALPPSGIIRSQIQINFLSNISTKPTGNRRGRAKSHSSSSSSSSFSSSSSSSSSLSKTRTSWEGSNTSHFLKNNLPHSGIPGSTLSPSQIPQQPLRNNTLNVRNLVRKQGQNVRMRFISLTHSEINPRLSFSSNHSVLPIPPLPPAAAPLFALEEAATASANAARSNGQKKERVRKARPNVPNHRSARKRSGSSSSSSSSTRASGFKSGENPSSFLKTAFTDGGRGDIRIPSRRKSTFPRSSLSSPQSSSTSTTSSSTTSSSSSGSLSASSSSSSSSSFSSSPASDRSHRHRRRRRRKAKRRRRRKKKRRSRWDAYWEVKQLAAAAAAPISLCTILTRFAPQDILQWREQHVVMPFRGESFSDNASHGSHAPPVRRASWTRRKHSHGGSSSRSSSLARRNARTRHNKSRPPAHNRNHPPALANSYGKEVEERNHGDAREGADAGGLAEEDTYQDFVVNSQFLRGNYEDVGEASSSATRSRSRSSSSTNSSRAGGHHKSNHHHHHTTTNTANNSFRYSRNTSRSGSSGSSRIKRKSNHGSSSSSSSSSSSTSRSSQSGRGEKDSHYTKHMRSYRKMLKRHVYRDNPAFYNAFFLDSGNITGGERRKKLIVLPSYRTSVISFVDKKILKKDLNNHFYVQHPELEVCGVKLTHLRKIKNELLVYALEEDSPLELSTVAHAYWYFERLVVQGMVGKANRKVVLAACVLLAIKFLETGDVSRKLQYFRNRWKRFHLLSSVMLGGGKAEAEEDEDNVKVDWEQVERSEFPAYVGLDFTLLQDLGSNVITTHIECLLQQINVTFQEYYSKKFVSPVYLNKYNYYSNLYY